MLWPSFDIKLLRSGCISMLEIIQSLAININEGPKRLFFTDLVPIEKKNVQLNEAVRSLILIE